jgi:ABC-type lipoprotein export system ATPase subunit
MYAIISTVAKVREKTIRYIFQDVQLLEKLERIEKTIHYYIQKRKRELKKNDSFKQIR